MIAVIEFNNLKPIICFTKLDLLNIKEKKEIRNIFKYYKSIGYKVYTNQQLFRLKRIFKNKITVFTGQSGVGKSSLLNMLNKHLNLKTGDISRALERGKNTTRHVELLELRKGLVADTPGFSAIDLIDMTREDIRNNFVEFNKYKDKCEYRDCFHLDEKKCAIKQAVANDKILLSRYNNYKKFMSIK
jgi:ribosome biogenesis GTPase